MRRSTVFVCPVCGSVAAPAGPACRYHGARLPVPFTELATLARLVYRPMADTREAADLAELVSQFRSCILELESDIRSEWEGTGHLETQLARLAPFKATLAKWRKP